MTGRIGGWITSMLNEKRRKEYDAMAVDVARGKAGYIPAKKSPLSKSQGKSYGEAPESLQ